MRVLHHPKHYETAKLLTSALSVAAAIGGVVLLFAWGAYVDQAVEAEAAPDIERAWSAGFEAGRLQERQAMLDSVRAAYRQGLREGHERERLASARAVGR